MRKLFILTVFISIITSPGLLAQPCPFPTNVVSTAISGNSITIDWNGTVPGNFQIRFAPQGSPLASAPITRINTKPYTVSGLNPNTTYQIQLRDSCGPTNFSFWSVTTNIATLCQVNAPFTTNFDGGAWTVGAFPNQLGTINNCWTRTPSTTPNAAWVVGPQAFTFGSGADVDHTSGSGKYMYVDNIGFTNPPSRSTELESPIYNLSPLTNPELVFWYHMFGNDIEDLNVYISTNGGQSYTLETTISGQQQTSTSDAWKEQVINLSAYANQNIRIKFENFEATPGFQNAICIDDVELREAPSCPRPLNLNLVSVNSSSASIGFSTGGASNWNLQYGTTGFTLGSGTVVNSSVNPAAISGLTPNTTYDVYVRDSCGPGDVSVWEGPLTFTTACVPVPAPYTENFDGSVFNPGAGFNAVGTISNCWTRTLGNLYFWKAGPPQFTPTNTGPQGDNTTGSGGYLFTESTGFTGLPITTDVESPLIDLTALTTPELTFYVHMFGGDITDLVVLIDDGSGYTAVNTQTGQQQVSKADSWKEVIVNLSAYTNDTIRLKFEGTRNGGFAADIAIDDISIAEAPSCPKPQNLSLNSVSINSATLSWTSGGASQWQFSYGAPNFSPNSGTLVPSNSNPGTLSGLSPNTTYEVYVRDSCGPGDVSAWAGPITIQTRCLPVAAPYTENFDGSAFTIGSFNNLGNYPTCWRRPLTSNYEWSVEDGNNFAFSTGPIADHTSGSGKYIYSQALFSAGPQSSTEAIVTSVLVDLSPLTIPEMSFWYHMFGSQIDSLAVYIDDGNAKTRVFGLTGQQQTSSNDAWQEATVNLSAFANDTIAVEFRAYRASQFGTQNETAIDDLSIYEQPNCPKPQNLTVNGVTATSVNLGWTSGGATNWRIEYGPAGFPQGTGTVVTASTNPFNITGLSSNTSYDFYVQDSCGVGDVSFYTGPISGRTSCSTVAAPLLENFDGVVFTPGIFFNDPGTIDPCWSRSDTTGYFWLVATGPSPVFNSGPSSDNTTGNTTGNGQYLFGRFTNNANTSTTISSLQIDLSPLTSPELRFFSHMFGQAIDRLSVEVWDGNTWTNELTLIGQNQTAKTDPWDENIVSLQSYLNDTIQVRFIATRQNAFSNQVAISIDDFEIREAPTCPRPSNVSTQNVTNNSLDVSWTSGGATNWNIAYRPSGSTAPFTIVNTNSNPFTITGLNASTSYEIQVRDSCGVGDVSLYTPLSLFTTACGIITAPYLENFNGPDWILGFGAQNTNNQISSCWSRPSGNAPNFGPNQGSTGSGSTGPNSDVTGTGKYLYTEYSGSPVGPGEITSPLVFLPSTLQNAQFKFAYHMYGSNIIDLKVKMSINGGAFNTIITKTGQQQTSSNAVWRFDSVALDQYTGDTLQFKFEGNSSSFTGDIAIDEMSVDGTVVPCAPITNLSLQNPTVNSLEVSWTTPNTNGIVNVSYYNVATGPGTATTVTGVGSPYTINNLNAGTAYVVAVFDSCGATTSVPVLDTLATLPCDTVTAAFSSNASFLNVNFNSSTTNADSLQWDFGGLGGSTQQNPNFGFPAGGTYTITLRAFNDCGNSDTTTQTITLCDTLTADFTFNAAGDSVSYSAANSTNASGFIWDLDEGISSTAQDTVVKYASTGQKTVTLTVYNNCGDTVSTTQTVDVCAPPVADWTYTILPPINSGLRIQFDGTSSIGAVTYDWDFGDGTTGTGPQPIHIYSTPGLFYVVELTVTNACGAKSIRKFALNQISLEEPVAQNNLELYPNPATAEVNLEWNAQNITPQSVSIFGLNGSLQQQVLIENSQSGAQTISLNGLAKGLYLVRVNLDKGVEQFKLRVN